MGIEHFSQFIKEHAPDCCFEIPLSNFGGHRLAIDISMLSYAMYSTAIKEIAENTSIIEMRPNVDDINNLALNKIIERLCVYVQHRITPVCVFDGKPHTLKGNGRKKKNEIKAKARAKERLANAENQLYNTEYNYRNQMMVDEYVKYYKQVTDLPEHFMVQLRDILESTGFKTVHAADIGLITNDAEGICAALCLKGNDYCVATVSNDSDYHVYGGNMEILDTYAKSVGGVKQYFVKVRLLESILQQCGLNFEQFRDLCIMLGTDYNPNIPQMGIKGCWTNITRYGGVVNMSASGIDVSPLCYPEVLKIFSSTIVKLDLPNLDMDIQQFRDCARETFDRYGLRDFTSLLIPYLEATA